MRLPGFVLGLLAVATMTTLAFNFEENVSAEYTVQANKSDTRLKTPDRIKPKPALTKRDWSKYILTPKPPKTPRINGAKIFGLRPGSPFLFTIPATGDRPMTFAAENLPKGLKLDAKTGQITGVIEDKTKKTYHVKFIAKNKLGENTRNFRIVVGDTLCLTPPMGWNSWYVYSEGISQDHVKFVAEQFVKKGLANHGWTYVNIDDCWQGDRNTPTKALGGNERFTKMKEMCDYVHSLGLKVGLYSTPWTGSYAGFRGGTCENEKGVYDRCLPENKRRQPNQIYGRYPGMGKFKVNKINKFWFGDVDAKQWAAWGFDYVKMDWNPNDVPTTKRIAKDLENSGRDIILSLSNAAPFANVGELSKYANLWRTGGDIHDNWHSICRCFNQQKWAKFAGPGHWNDTDMLQVGMLGAPNRFNVPPRQCNLTPDEQYTHISMWSLQAAPLLLSCYVEHLDEFTLSLLTNDEVLNVNQDPLGHQATRVAKLGQTEVWMKKMEDGSKAVGLFNRGNRAGNVEIDFTKLGLTGKHIVRDLWRQKDLGTFEGKFSAKVNRHGVVLVQIRPAK